MLELHDVRVAYDGVEVLHDVDVAVAAGSIVALVGPNGAGKSSLCSAAAGLVTPTAGTIRLGGVDLTGVAAHQRARLGLQLAPEGRGIFAALTVEENLRLSLPHAADRSAAYDRFAPLAERRNLPAGVLSGGEQQMLALAPALVRPPRVLVADEPSLGLAPLVVEQIHQLFGELRKTGTAVVVVEERLHELLPVVDQVVVLDLGRVAWAGPAAAVDDEQLKEIYLGTSGGGLPAQSAPSA